MPRHPLVEHMGLSQEMLASVGAIAVVSAYLESQIETCIWMLEGKLFNEKTGAIITDGKPISDLLIHLDKLGAKHEVEPIGKLIQAWCRAAVPCFKCRNSIFHGPASRSSPGWIEFRSNWPILEGTDMAIERKRGASTFHASENTLSMLEEAFRYLYDGLTLTSTAVGLNNIDPGLASSWVGNLGRARSIGAELQDLASAVNHEKY